ncbi:MAG: type II secretion system secretin GspD [Pseudomonadota bacterium]|nr:type II secretion system secretin GspD [Pseudomonadota bacterium]MEC8768386.1 type II secretion system secretin GspD [Pseudomonadota bacterium]
MKILFVLLFTLISFTTNAQISGGLNYKDADLREFIEDVALATRKTFIIDPGVSGKVNLISSQNVDSELLFEIFLSVLKVNGYAATSTVNGGYKIIPVDAAFKDSVEGDSKGDRIATKVFFLRYTDPVKVLGVVQQYVNPKGLSFAREGLQAVVVSDYAHNLSRIESVISEIDVDNSVVKIVKLKNTSAREMADVARQIASENSNNQSSYQSVQAIPIIASNSLILKGQLQTVERYFPIIENLDLENASNGSLKVVKLKYANSETLLPTLQALSDSIAAPDAGANKFSAEKIIISNYVEGNAIIIKASADAQKKIIDLIYSLDTPRAQVLVEAIIVEVSNNAAKSLGVQYVLAGGKDSKVPFTVSNYSNTSPNILAATGALVLDNTSDNIISESADNLSGILRSAAIDSMLGINGLAVGAAGTRSDGGIFGVILNALSGDVKSNILSTPSIMTLDNEPAKFIVGQEIPITTGEALGSSNTNPFRTIDRKNVGVQLEVVPQINEGDEIRLKIRQEVSSVSGPLATTSTELITNKREMETTVRVGDGEIIVLGGLIQQDETISVDKIPLLGSIPVLGKAFSSEQKSKSNTNLMVFLRPTIVRTSDDARAVTELKYGYISDSQKKAKTKLSLNDMMQDVVGVTSEQK